MTTTDWTLYIIGVAALVFALITLNRAVFKRPLHRYLMDLLVCVGVALALGQIMDRIKRTEERADLLEKRLEAVEKAHAEEELISPLVEEIYSNIHDLQDRAGALEMHVDRLEQP